MELIRIDPGLLEDEAEFSRAWRVVSCMMDRYVGKGVRWDLDKLLHSLPFSEISILKRCMETYTEIGERRGWV